MFVNDRFVDDCIPSDGIFAVFYRVIAVVAHDVCVSYDASRLDRCSGTKDRMGNFHSISSDAFAEDGLIDFCVAYLAPGSGVICAKRAIVRRLDRRATPETVSMILAL